jgi:hypothetical protein
MRIRVGIFMVLLLALAGALPSDAQMVSAEGEDIKWGADPAVPGAKFGLIQVHGVGPTSITFVDPADDPRKK